MIELKHVYKSYGSRAPALKDVSLKIGKGEFLFLMGPSGAGKTSLFRLISGQELATSGSVQVCGLELSKLSAQGLPRFRRQVGVVFQDFRLLVDKSVEENVSLPLKILGDSRAQIHFKVSEILEQVGLSHKAKEKPIHLSGGEQQRVAIARAVIHRPGILIADEPTGNLDPEMSLEIMELLEKVNARGTTVFVATHDRDLALRPGRPIVRLKKGELDFV